MASDNWFLFTVVRQYFPLLLYMWYNRQILNSTYIQCTRLVSADIRIHPWNIITINISNMSITPQSFLMPLCNTPHLPISPASPPHQPSFPRQPLTSSLSWQTSWHCLELYENAVTQNVFFFCLGSFTRCDYLKTHPCCCACPQFIRCHYWGNFANIFSTREKNVDVGAVSASPPIFLYRSPYVQTSCLLATEFCKEGTWTPVCSSIFGTNNPLPILYEKAPETTPLANRNVSSVGMYNWAQRTGRQNHVIRSFCNSWQVSTDHLLRTIWKNKFFIHGFLYLDQILPKARRVFRVNMMISYNPTPLSAWNKVRCGLHKLIFLLFLYFIPLGKVYLFIPHT